MRRISLLACLLSLTLAPIGISSPIDGSWGGNDEISPSGVKAFAKTFRGGERACVLAIGDRLTLLTDLTLRVFDQNGILVAEDRGSGLAGDCVAVIWYPPRDGAYRIELRNPGAIPSNTYIAIK